MEVTIAIYAPELYNSHHSLVVALNTACLVGIAARVYYFTEIIYSPMFSNAYLETKRHWNMKVDGGWCLETFIQNGSINLNIKFGFAGVCRSLTNHVI